MREILFRGKAEVNNEWVFGDLLHIKEKSFIRTECGTQFLVRPETVGQYTGINTWDGRRIFEGDILRTYDQLFRAKFIGEVRWHEKSGAFCIKEKQDEDLFHFNWTDYEPHIIGNMTDSPEELNEDPEALK